LEYPSELNPFGSDDDEEDEIEEDKSLKESKESQKENYDKNGKETEKRPVSVVNPFDDTDEEEDLKENEEMKESISWLEWYISIKWARTLGYINHTTVLQYLNDNFKKFRV